MPKGALCSFLLHVLIILLIIVGLPSFLRPEEFPQPIPVGIVTEADLTALSEEKIPARPKKAEKPPEKPAEVKAEPPPPTPPTPPPLPEPEPAAVAETAPPPPTPAPEPEPVPEQQQAALQPEPQPEPPPAPEPEPEPAVVLPPPEPPPEPKVAPPEPPPVVQPPPPPEEPPPPEAAVEPKLVPEKKPTPPKQTVKQPTAEQVATDFASVLKNVEKLKRQAVAQPQAEPETPPQSEQTEYEQPLTSSEVDALREQIERCWNVPAGARDAKNLIVEIRVRLNPDGSVFKPEILDTSRMATDGFFRAAAESAQRAVLMCSPLQLPPSKYSKWQIVTFRFDPSHMF